MSKPLYRRAVVVGVGLIGGSVCLALRQRGLAEQVVGVVRQEDRVQRALDSGVVSEATADLAAACKEADLVLVATPVATVAPTAVAAATAAASGALITDAGSTKAEIVASAESAWPADAGASFVGSHPLAGDHRTGPEAARADLFEGAVTVVTATENTPASAAQQVRALWESLGSQVVEMTPEQHDVLLASASHVPHVAAAAVAATTPDDALRLTAGGWADTTRVASGSPSLWREILLANRGPIAEGVRRLSDELSAYADAIDTADGDTIERLLEAGRRQRDALGN